MNADNIRIGVIGLGYVGLPLAVEFGKKYTTFGFEMLQLAWLMQQNDDQRKHFFTMDLINNSKTDDSFSYLITKAVILGASLAFLFVLVLGLLSV